MSIDLYSDCCRNQNPQKKLFYVVRFWAQTGAADILEQTGAAESTIPRWILADKFYCKKFSEKKTLYVTNFTSNAQNNIGREKWTEILFINIR